MSVFGSSHVIVTDRLIGKRVHTGPPSHPISPPNQCDCTRFSVIFCCGMPLKLICSLSARNTPLVISTCPSVCPETLPHLCCVCVSAACVSCLLAESYPSVCCVSANHHYFLLHSDESRNISWLRSGLSAFHSGFVLRPLFTKSMRAVSNLESLHIKVIQC